MGLDDPDYDPWNPPADAPAPASDQSEEGDVTPPWEDYAQPRQEPPTRVKKKGKWTCPQHGPLCNPGICKERARVERDERMRNEREKWEEEKKQREFRRAKEQQKRERKNAGAMGEGERESGRERPPHLRENAPSSSSSSNNSGSDSERSHNRGIVFHSPTTLTYSHTHT